MEKKFLLEQMKRIETNYGVAKFNANQQVFDLWYEMFSKHDPNGFKIAVDEYMRTNEFAPNIAGINKIYQRLSDEREHLEKIIKAKYKWVAHWFEEPLNVDTYKDFVDYVCHFPMSERESVAENLAYKLVAYWNDCAERGVPKEARFSISEYLRSRNER